MIRTLDMLATKLFVGPGVSKVQGAYSLKVFEIRLMKSPKRMTRLPISLSHSRSFGEH